MARHSSAWVNWSQYLAARLAAMGLTFFDVRTNLRTAAALGRALHRFDHRHRQRARRHLAMCFHDLSDQQIDHLVHQSFEHFVQLVVEVCHTPRLLHRETWSQRIKLDNLGPALELMGGNRPCLMLTGHLGNWEVLGYFLTMIGYQVEAVARPIDNPLINDWLLGIRERKGLRVITKWKATGRMLNVLSAGGALGFIADQNAGDKGLFVPFFGRLASTYKSIGLLAMDQNAPIICGYAARFGDDYQYRLGVEDIIYPDDWTKQPDPLYYITARYSRALENMIRRNPSQYLWMHRRWKSRPRYERLGKPMPKALRRNLEALPWMDQGTLDRLALPMPE